MNFGPVPLAILGKRSGGGAKILGYFYRRRQWRELKNAAGSNPVGGTRITAGETVSLFIWVECVPSVCHSNSGLAS
jgi:hypothetical protein